MIGRSQAFRDAEKLIVKIAAHDAPVLIEGETGTGKELAARAIHYFGPRRDQPFVPVNCGALPDHLVENELFGHRRGAFTDAREDHLGVIALARRGTLFLDEVDALTLKGQVTLLRFLHDQQYRPLGSRHEEQADVRIVTASNQCLQERAANGQFRVDLLYRLKLMHLELPPLRERHGDIAFLAQHFLGLASTRFKMPAKMLAADTLAWFERYDWPGNIRELEHLVYREFLLAEGSEISVPEPASLSQSALSGPSSRSLNYRAAKAQAIREFESHFLAQIIASVHGNVSAGARLCGTERRHFGRLLKKYQIARPDSQS